MATWIVVIGWISRAVLVLLLGLSVWSVAIMVNRARLFRMLQAGAIFHEATRLIRERNWDGLQKWVSGNSGFHSGVIRAALDSDTRDPELIDRAVRSFVAGEKSVLESGLTTLATLGSNAPFIGLFGTVLGIIQAFGVLAESQYGSTAVMKGISEALIATAVGLFVAIPAVIAYNYFSRKLKTLITEGDSLADLFISRFCQSHPGKE